MSVRGQARGQVLADRARVNRVDLDRHAISNVAAQVELQPVSAGSEMDSRHFDAPFVGFGGDRSTVEAEKEFVER